jgi:galactokinase
MASVEVGTVPRVTGPGRVNLIGDHTDYNQGLALPMAIDLGVTVEFVPHDGRSVTVRSTAFAGEVVLPLDGPAPRRAGGGDAAAGGDADRTVPAWARPLAAVVDLCRPETGGTLTISSELPVGAGLSSSAAAEVALAGALGVTGPALVVARLCQLAEHRAGVPVGLLDPLACAGGRRGHALLIDFADPVEPTVQPVLLPGSVEFVVVDSGQRRSLRDSAYAVRVAECEAATATIGPLGMAGPDDVAGLRDPVLRRRARHVVTECRRVVAMTEALAADDPVGAGLLVDESHASLADDFAVSTAVLDDLVADLRGRPGVLGARLTGAGFGGCVIAVTRPGALDPAALPQAAWRVVAADGTLAATGRSGQ